MKGHKQFVYMLADVFANICEHLCFVVIINPLHEDSEYNLYVNLPIVYGLLLT